MTNGKNHIIHQLRWEIQTDNFNDATNIQAAISRASSEVERQIEHAFDTACPSHKWLQLDRLEIDLGELKKARLEFNFEKELIQKLKSQLFQSIEVEREKSQSQSIQVGEETAIAPAFAASQVKSFDGNLSHRAIELLEYVLQYGVLPWWYSATEQFNFNETFQEVIERANTRELLRIKKLTTQERMRERMWLQLNEKNRDTLLKKIGVEQPKDSPAAEDETSAVGNEKIREALMILVFHELLRNFLDKRYAKPAISKKIIWHAWLPVFASDSSPALAIEKSLPQIFLLLMEAINDSKSQDWNASDRLKYYRQFLEELLSHSQTIGIQSTMLQLPEWENLTQDELSNMVREVLQVIASSQVTPAKILDEVFKSRKTEKEEAKYQKKKDHPAENTIIPCRNAGLVLLWPYLNGFFKKLEMIKDKAFISSIAQQKAALLLHHLATGQIEAEEHELTVNKLLCGLEIDFPVERTLEMSEFEQSECQELLQAMIDNWKILKSTSIEGLRGTFLQRPGFIERKKDQYVIKLERTTIDMLIDHIGYGLETIVLPWRKDMLRCEW